MMDLRELYQDIILDHGRHPRNFRAIEHPTHFAQGHNPLCGDRVTVYLTLDGDRIADVSFQGRGCAISTAAASLMTEVLKGKTVAEAYDRLYYFERACQVQLYAMWTGRPLKEVPAHIVARTLRQYADSPSYGGKPACEHHFAALKRLLDRSEPDYAD